jgi:hypothetical protein
MIKSSCEKYFFLNEWFKLNRIVNTSITVSIVVMNEDQKWFCFENGSYTNESPLPTFDRTAAQREK